MTIHCPHCQSERITTREIIKISDSFVGVIGSAVRGTNRPQHRIPIRLRFNRPDLHVPLFDRNNTQQLGIAHGKTDQRESEQDVTMASYPASELCPFAVGGNCPPSGHLNVKLGGEPLGCFVFRIPSVTILRTLLPRRRSLPAQVGKRGACLPLELRLRDKSISQRQDAGIYYADLTLRSGRTLEKTLANARGTASRWFRSDRSTD